MTALQETPRTRYLEADEILLVVKPGDALQPDIFLALHPDGTASAFNGHVDLGTGIRTALAQIVAEELDLPFERVRMVLGSTTAAPDQGATIASETIQVTAIPLRQAAATARQWLLEQAALRYGEAPQTLTVEEGIIHPEAPANWSITFGELIAGRHERIAIDVTAPLKRVENYRIDQLAGASG